MKKINLKELKKGDNIAVLCGGFISNGSFQSYDSESRLIAIKGFGYRETLKIGEVVGFPYEIYRYNDGDGAYDANFLCRRLIQMLKSRIEEIESEIE